MLAFNDDDPVEGNKNVDSLKGDYPRSDYRRNMNRFRSRKGCFCSEFGSKLQYSMTKSVVSRGNCVILLFMWVMIVAGLALGNIGRIRINYASKRTVVLSHLISNWF